MGTQWRGSVSTDGFLKAQLLLLDKIHRQSVCLIPKSELAHAQRESLLFLFIINSTSRDLSTEHKSSALL